MASKYPLTKAALKSIMQGLKLKEPVLQILGSKKLQAGSADRTRYRLLVSDGEESISFAMFTIQSGNSCPENFSIVKLNEYQTNEVTNAKGSQTILLIMSMEVLVPGETVGTAIGNPTPMKDTVMQRKEAQANPTTNVTKVVKSNPQPQSNSSNLNQTLSERKIISPISAITPYHNKWVIKARVTNKSSIRTWSNSKGEGQLFSFDLIDESGEIRCTAFRDLVDKFYELIQVDKVYFISKCQLKPANKAFCFLKNDYEMTLGTESMVEECLECDTGIPQVKYDFVPIEKIGDKNVGDVVDVIGVCKQVSELQTFTSKSSNRELKKKELILIDQTKTSIVLTLWGTQAESFNGSDNPVVVVKGAKVGEFGGGKNLSTLISTQLKLNPDIPESCRIRHWYDSEGNNVEAKNLSERSGVVNIKAPWLSLKEVHDLGLGQSERGDYYQTVATILLVRSESAVYKACANTECNRKIIDMNNGMYRCEKCNREYPSFKYRLLVSMNIGDWTANQWVTLFASEAEKILGKTSQEIGELLANDGEAAAEVFQVANFKKFLFRCRAKMETYNDEQRLKTVVVKVDPINYEEYNAHLLEGINTLIP